MASVRTVARYMVTCVYHSVEDTNRSIQEQCSDDICIHVRLPRQPTSAVCNHTFNNDTRSRIQQVSHPRPRNHHPAQPYFQ